MEEADILADKIAVLVKGELKAVGTSLELKKNFAGYKLLASFPKSAKEKFEKVIGTLSAVLTSERSTSDGETWFYSYMIESSSDNERRIIQFFQEVEMDERIKCTIGQTSLEEVFLKLTEEDYSQIRIF
jgi:ABC-type multidrug transport system ATPase subunit